MKFFKNGLAILIVGMLLLSCTACSGMESLTDGLKGGVKQFGDNVAIGESNALITPYRSFDGTRTSDSTAFLATYDAAVVGFDGQDILVGNTDLQGKDCREITVHYSFVTISGTCQLIYIDPELEETVLAENAEGSVTVQLKAGANYIGLYGDDYEGTIQITVE